MELHGSASCCWLWVTMHVVFRAPSQGHNPMPLHPSWVGDFGEKKCWFLSYGQNPEVGEISACCSIVLPLVDSWQVWAHDLFETALKWCKRVKRGLPLVLPNQKYFALKLGCSSCSVPWPDPPAYRHCYWYWYWFRRSKVLAGRHTQQTWIGFADLSVILCKFFASIMLAMDGFTTRFVLPTELSQALPAAKLSYCINEAEGRSQFWGCTFIHHWDTTSEVHVASSQTHVSDLGCAISCQKNIGALQVQVNDSAGVHVNKTSHNIQGHHLTPADHERVIIQCQIGANIVKSTGYLFSQSSQQVHLSYDMDLCNTLQTGDQTFPYRFFTLHNYRPTGLDTLSASERSCYDTWYLARSNPDS